MTQENTIKLNRQEIIDSMWDNCEGSHVLAVAPDGSDHEVHWCANQSQWDNWPAGWLTIGIPALAPADWAEDREETQDFLAEAFLAACNGYGVELNTSAPWGMSGDEYHDYEVVEPPAEFEWAEEAEQPVEI